MKQLPAPETYVDGLDFWPYKSSLTEVLEYVTAHAPVSAHVLDIMCGPGYLLGKIGRTRRDLILTGVDTDERYVSYGRETQPSVNFTTGDVLTWRPESLPDVVVCTGSIHHVPYEMQEAAIKNIASMVVAGGFAVISDCYVDDYANETERKLAAAKLGYQYLVATIAKKAPEKVVSWTLDILTNDVLMDEYKMSLAKRLPLIKGYFLKVETIKTWPAFESGYGDYIHICRN
ncbi:MAG: trans-aconitate 2-methyltransferase [Candidatus Kaiserbacteria bacterium]|nr:trans-aconitate 2-methyltransferase [Candidatus Kaiserbacteria bacterium]